jgi:hypothetical protein
LRPSETQASHAEIAAKARLVVERTTTENEKRRASILPAYQEGDFEFEQHGASLMGRVLVTREVYERIRKSDRPIFSHIISWEMGREVAVDPSTGGAIAILDSWL